MINKIDESSVHKLTSGQVVVDLPTAVKELVENSLDAHATAIEVRFKQYGIESVEVIDNGDGISEQDICGTALKHHTSKIQDFCDLESVSTFGFRGEALSSLCAVSTVKITTCTASDLPRATRIEYDSAGKIKDRNRIAGIKGTSVTIGKLFEDRLPVRRLDLVKNSRREFGKCITILQAYGIISKNVRFLVVNLSGTGKRTVLFATTGNSDVSKNIVNIYGPKQVSDLKPYKFKILITPKRSIRRPDPVTYHVSIEGYISRPSPGCGRTSSDRQLVYVNGRPCSLPIISKCINECYRSFNVVQYPFFIANICIGPENIDVNVSPDKRIILLHDETAIAECFRESLTSWLESLSFTVTSVRQTVLTQLTDHSHHLNQADLADKTDILSSMQPSLNASHQHHDLNNSKSESQNIDNEESDNDSENDIQNGSEEVEQRSIQSRRNQNDIKSKLQLSRVTRNQITDDRSKMQRMLPSLQFMRKRDGEVQEEEIQTPGQEEIESEYESEDEIGQPQEETEVSQSEEQTGNLVRLPDFIGIESAEVACHMQSATETAEFLHSIEDKPTSIEENSNSDHDRVKQLIESARKSTCKEPSLSTHSQLNPTVCQYQTTLNISDLSIYKLGHSDQKLASGKGHLDLALERGEEYLASMEISKDDFQSMRIIGQFNLGFILTVLQNSHSPRSDLFIIDQHASDEKYNFEQLEQHSVISRQPLVHPAVLDLTPIEKIAISTHEQTFIDNGFQLKFSADTVSLVSVPLIMGHALGIQDLMELVHAVIEYPSPTSNSTTIKCSRVRKLFAMKACRSSIMIGTALKTDRMRRIIDNLGTLDKPWNCPHGRPTMRHLTTLDDWCGWSEQDI
ncbi:uncharacterized protein V1516DRAFT_308052 [Lipomyces oligophaga]|uniref:uncharacterized protein n=1 Tax=Lipomyces oligophaga TaxID=45792 RepID=UPI0034CEB035